MTIQRSIIQQMANGRIDNYALPGLSSSLIGGPEYGKVRLLQAERYTAELVTPHNHRFDLACVVLSGKVENTIYEPTIHPGNEMWALGELRPKRGGLGKYTVKHDVDRKSYCAVTKAYGANEAYSMKSHQIHSIRFAKGTKVLFFEGPEVEDYSIFLEPVTSRGVVETFKTEPWMFLR